MRNFTLAALAAVTVHAEYQTMTTTLDNNPHEAFFRSQDWSSIGQTTADSAQVNNNNSMLIKDYDWDGQQFAFKPYLRGGAMQYTVDLSTVPCGCVAGVYAVKLDDFGCSEESLATADRNPACPSIDVMQANPYGFNVAAHPCANGTCDARSQCEYNMREQGKETYGEAAYGPGGSLIDTDLPFQVKTEFVSDRDYQLLWGIRTKLMQGNEMILLEADCGDYIAQLSGPIEGNMGYVVSAWDNTDGQNADFECEGACPAPAASCAGAVNSVSDFKFWQYGYNEDQPEPTPEPDSDDDEDNEPTPTPPQPADFEGFVANSDQMGGDWEFYVKGLDGAELTTQGTEITIGENNRAFVTDYPYDSNVFWAYHHEYLGSSVDFDVNVADVPCACAAGVYLAQLNEDECSWNAKDEGVTPQCASIDIMEANLWGFNTQSSPCEWGTCDQESQCRQKANDSEYETWAYGPGDYYTIDSMYSYHVTTEFWSTADASELYSIVTILTQGDATVVLEQECDGHLAPMTWLMSNMSLGVSNYDVGLNNDISGGECYNSCTDAEFKISNIVWSSGNAVDDEDDESDEPGELIVDGVAQSLDQCEGECSECHEAHYANRPNEVVYECVDTTQYKYGNICTPQYSKWSEDLCMTSADSYCHKSYPHNDPDKMRSLDAECRTIPTNYIEGDFKFARGSCWSPTGGLCEYGCDGTCHTSWLRDDAQKWKSPSSMCRCQE